MGVTNEHLIYLAEKPEADAKRVTGKSTKEEVVKAFDTLARRGADDLVFIVLIGHGRSNGEARSSICRGPT